MVSVCLCIIFVLFLFPPLLLLLNLFLSQSMNFLGFNVSLPLSHWARKRNKQAAVLCLAAYWG